MQSAAAASNWVGVAEKEKSSNQSVNGGCSKQIAGSYSMLSTAVVSDIPKHKVRLMEHDLSAAKQVQEAVACLPARLQAMLATDTPSLAASKDRSMAT